MARWKWLSQLKWRGLLLELLVVFIGVYLAFWLNGVGERQKNLAQSQKVLSSLKLELEHFRYRMPELAAFQRSKVKEWEEALAEDRVVDFYNYYFIQPQYDYRVIEYALSTRETEVVDFALFHALRSLDNEIRRLRDAEDRMTEVSLQFRNLPADLPRDAAAAQVRAADNRFLFLRFIRFAESRAGIMARLAESAEEALAVINERMPRAERVKVEQQLLRDYLAGLEALPPRAEAEEMIRRFFPDFTEAETAAVLEVFYASEGD